MEILESLESLKSNEKVLALELVRTVELIQPSHITEEETESHTSCDLLGFCS